MAERASLLIRRVAMSECCRRRTSALLLTLLALSSLPVRVGVFGMVPVGSTHDAHASWHMEEEPGICELPAQSDSPQQYTPPADDRSSDDSLDAVRGCAQLVYCPTDTAAPSLTPVPTGATPPAPAPDALPSHARDLIRPPRS